MTRSSGGLDSPADLTFGPDGNLYVLSATTNDVRRYNGTTGAFIDVFASGGGLSGPVDLAFAPEVTAVPEPGTMALLITGLVGLRLRGGRVRSRKAN